MGLDINTNMLANTVADNLSMNQAKLQNSLEKLSTGYNINKAADDSSGLVISQHLQSAIAGFQQGMTNTQNGINVIQTADGALNEVSNILQRIKTLAVEVGNGTAMDSSAIAAANAEARQSLTAIDQIANSTSFGNNLLLTLNSGGTNGGTTTSGNYINFNFLVGDNTSTDAVSFSIGALNALSMALGSQAAATAAQSATTASAAVATGTTDLSGSGFPSIASTDTLSISVNGTAHSVSFSSSQPSSLSALVTAINGTSGLSGVASASADGKHLILTGSGTGTSSTISVSGSVASALMGTATSATGTAAAPAQGYNAFDLTSSAALGNINNAISNVAATRGTLGAYQNELQHVANNESTMVQNLQSSNAAVQDTNMAKEMVNFTQKQVLVQAGVSLLSQANASSQSVLKLLGG